MFGNGSGDLREILACNTYKPHYKHRITSTGLQEISARYDDPDDERACEHACVRVLA